MNACGEKAFTFIDDPRGKALKSSNAILPNGHHPKKFSPITCGSCGSKIRYPEVELELKAVAKYVCDEKT